MRKEACRGCADKVMWGMPCVRDMHWRQGVMPQMGLAGPAQWRSRLERMARMLWIMEGLHHPVMVSPLQECSIASSPSGTWTRQAAVCVDRV